MSNIRDLINVEELEDMKREGEYHLRDLLENTHPVAGFGAIRSNRLAIQESCSGNWETGRSPEAGRASRSRSRGG